MNDIQREHWFSIAGFFPFVGWLLPLYLCPESDRCQKIGRESMVMVAFTTGMLLLLNLLIITVMRNHVIFELIFVVLVYTLDIAYLAISGFGIYKSARNEDFVIPCVSRYASSLNI
jgi:hypothetical protein